MTNTTKELEKQEITYSVYIHKNKINNKVYIGVTSKKPKQRWRNGKGYVNQRLFYSAIQKYGWDNFTHRILFKELTKEEAGKKEQELIDKYKSNIQEYGYNITKGGFEFDEDRAKSMKKGRLKKKAKISIYSYINHEEIIFNDIDEASSKTGLSVQYIKDCCEKIIINKSYDISYCDKKLYD